MRLTTSASTPSGTACVTPSGTVIPASDAGQPQPAPVDGGLPPVMVDGGAPEVVLDAGLTEVDPNVAEPLPADPPSTQLQVLDPVRGGCSAAPGMLLLGLLAWGQRRRV